MTSFDQFIKKILQTLDNLFYFLMTQPGVFLRNENNINKYGRGPQNRDGEMEYVAKIIHKLKKKNE